MYPATKNVKTMPKSGLYLWVEKNGVKVSAEMYYNATEDEARNFILNHKNAKTASFGYNYVANGKSIKLI